MDRKKYLVKNTLIFSMGNLGTKLITFFLVPLYTSALSTQEYGTVDLITTIVIIAVPIIFLNIGEAVMRFALDKDADSDGIMSIGCCVIAFSALPGVALAFAMHFYKPVSEYAFYIFLYSVTMGCCQVLLCYLRGKEMLLEYSIGSILQTLCIAGLNIIFLLVLKKGINGYLTAYIISYAITVVYCIIVSDVLRIFKNFHINKKLAKEMIEYSVVLIPNSFMWWIMNSSDRIMVTSMISVAANGIYAISYKLPTLVTTLTSIFNQAWSYSAIKEEGSSDEDEYNNKVFKILTCAVMLIGISVIAFSKLFLKIYVAESYYSAWQYIPFLAVGCVYLTLGTFMATSYTVHKDSFGYLFSGMFGAILNVTLNFVLIPKIGVYGAALATGISYIAVFVFRLFHTRKYIYYDIKNKEFLFGSIALLVVSILVFVDSIMALFIQVVVVFVSVCFYSSVWLPIAKLLFHGLKNRG